MSDVYTEAVARQLVSSKFRYIPARNPAFDLEFGVGGRFDPKHGFTAWELTHDERKQCLALVIRGVRGIVFYGYLTKDGEWQGRDRETNGTITVRPKDTLHQWVLFFKPLEFYKTVQVDKSVESFSYLEPLPVQFSWDDKYETVVKSPIENRTAIALVIYNRPIYAQQVVHTIAQNDRINEYPVYVFADYFEKTDLIDEQIKNIKERLPQAVIVRRPINFGCGRNLIDARRQLFDNCGYDRVFVMEDDMLVTKNYFNYCEAFLDWAESTYGNVGMVQGWTLCKMGYAAKKSRLSHVKATFENLWGYLMSRTCWDSIKQPLYKYEKLFLGGEYAKRPHRSVVHWFNGKRKLGAKTREGVLFPTDEAWEIDAHQYLDGPPSGQDAATAILMHQEGWVRLSPHVNRGKYIGKDGIHMNANWFNRMGYHMVELQAFPDVDAEPTFEARPVDKDVEAFI